MRLFCVFSFILVAVAQDYIEGQYFIQVDGDIIQNSFQEDAFVDRLESEFNIGVQEFYDFGNHKFIFVMADESVIELVRQLEEVKLVEQDSMAYATQNCSEVLHPGNWGLDRIDQREQLSYSQPDEFNATYTYNKDSGSAVRVYVYDTGIDVNHTNFEGRAEWGYVASGITNQEPGDVNSHGTHCAGTIASRDHGVAKDATVVAVKVLNDDGSGPWSAVIEGLNWLRLNDTDRGTHACASMSLVGSGQNVVVAAAVEALIADGVPVVVAAGDNNLDACGQTPAYIPDCITVGATSVTDNMVRDSNTGVCVDILAPGDEILSTVPGGGTGVKSGTSMACSHAAGAVARYMGTMDPPPTPANVIDFLNSQATLDAIKENLPPDMCNCLLYYDCDSS